MDNGPVTTAISLTTDVGDYSISFFLSFNRTTVYVRKDSRVWMGNIAIQKASKLLSYDEWPQFARHLWDANDENAPERLF